MNDEDRTTWCGGPVNVCKVVVILAHGIKDFTPYSGLANRVKCFQNPRVFSDNTIYLLDLFFIVPFTLVLVPIATIVTTIFFIQSSSDGFLFFGNF